MIFISWCSFLSRALCKLWIDKEHAFIKSQKFHVLHLDSFDLDSENWNMRALHNLALQSI